PAHTFLTGLVKVADGGRTMEVEVQAFDSTSKEPETVCCFKVAAEPRLLTEAGVSFALPRGAPHKDNAELVVARDRPELHPDATVVLPNQGKPREKLIEGETIGKLLEKAPIDFQIQYKNEGEKEFQNVEVAENGMVREPEEGTEVRFQLKRRKNT